MKALSEKLHCTIRFIAAYSAPVEGAKDRIDTAAAASPLRKAFRKSPLASYAFFRNLHEEDWHLVQRVPQHHAFAFLARYELTYLEPRLSRQGQVLYRFAHKIAHRRPAEFILDPLDPVGTFIQNGITHDQFLHLTCSPE